MIILIPDTNFFLHCKPAYSVEWSVLLKNESSIFIHPLVTKEIDNFKGQGNSRKAKKARQLNKLFNKILEDEKGEIVLLNSPKVVMSFFPPIDQTKNYPLTLDPNVNDDKILIDAIRLQDSSNQAKVIIFTSDTGLKVKAAHHGLSYLNPPDKWILEPEPDSRDKTINELKSKLIDIQKKIPVVSYDSSIESNKPLCVPIYSMIDETEKGLTVKKIIEDNPLETDFNETPSAKKEDLNPFERMEWIAPKKEEIIAYTEEKYPSWKNDVTEYVETVSGIIGQSLSCKEFTFKLKNESDYQADNVIITIESFDCLVELRNDDHVEYSDHETLLLPSAPTPPKGRWVKRSILPSRTDLFSLDRDSLVHNFRGLSSARAARDPYGFYLDEGSFNEKNNRLRLHASRFRHKLRDEYFHIHVYPIEDKSTYDAKIIINISAENIPNSLKEIISIQFENNQMTHKILLSEISRLQSAIELKK